MFFLSFSLSLSVYVRLPLFFLSFSLSLLSISISLSYIIPSFCLSYFCFFFSLSLFYCICFLFYCLFFFIYIHIYKITISFLSPLSLISFDIPIYLSLYRIIHSLSLSQISIKLSHCMPSSTISLSLWHESTLDCKVILVPPNSQNFVLSSFSYRSWERFFV
jgi:hypothetical protein